MPDVHAILSPSSAARWLNCQKSARLTADMPDTGSVYSAEGRIAHSLGELKLRKFFYSGIGPKKFQNEKAKLKKELADVFESPEAIEESFKEMDACTDVYLDAVKDISLAFSSTPYVALEQPVSFTDYVPEGSGTADCILISDNVLHIIDYKHGKGVAVDAQDNPQLKLYALGAYLRYRFIYPINVVRMSIVQPRNGGVSDVFETSAEDLMRWAENEVKPKAALAFAGEGEFKAGAWCRFCKVKQTCRARSEHYLSLQEFKRNPPELLNHAEIGQALKTGKELSAWLSDVEDYALSALLSGESIDGWKAVEGRSVRGFTNQEEAFKQAMLLGVDEAMLWERKPVTLAGLEKIMGKKAFQDGMAGFVVSPPGKPTLAPESDKRPAISNISSVEDDFSA